MLTPIRPRNHEESDEQQYRRQEFREAPAGRPLERDPVAFIVNDLQSHRFLAQRPLPRGRQHDRRIDPPDADCHQSVDKFDKRLLKFALHRRDGAIEVADEKRRDE